MSPKEIVAFVKELYGDQSFIALHEPRFRGNEKKYLLDCIDSTYVSSVGKYVDEFEVKLAEYCKSNFAVAMVNGTAALHLALVVSGVQRDDLVLTQALSFVATSNAISYTGASPLFLDSEMESLGMCPEKLKTFLENHTELRSDGLCYHLASGRRISACVPMHCFGHPCKIDAIAALCNSHHLALIEDAAESIGSTYKGIATGNFGLMGVLSFNGNKTITSGGGGAVITNDEAMAKKLKHLSTQAKVPHRWEFNHDAIAYNYRMPNINAALACAQLEQLPEFLDAKRNVARSYSDFFEGSQLTFIKEPEHAVSNYWLCSVLFPSLLERNEFLAYSNLQGCMTRPSWTLLNKLPMYQSCMRDDLSNAEQIENRLVNLPSSVPLA